MHDESDFKDCYRILGVPPSASQGEIDESKDGFNIVLNESALTRLPKDDQRRKEELLKDVNEAYDEVKNDEKRKAYDKKLVERNERRNAEESKRAEKRKEDEKKKQFEPVIEFLSRGDFEGAVSKVLSLLTAFPADTDYRDACVKIYREWATRLAEEGKYKEAAAKLQKAGEYCLDETISTRIQADLEVLRSKIIRNNEVPRRESPLSPPPTGPERTHRRAPEPPERVVIGPSESKGVWGWVGLLAIVVLCVGAWYFLAGHSRKPVDRNNVVAANSTPSQQRQIPVPPAALSQPVVESTGGDTRLNGVWVRSLRDKGYSPFAVEILEIQGNTIVRYQACIKGHAGTDDLSLSWMKDQGKFEHLRGIRLRIHWHGNAIDTLEVVDATVNSDEHLRWTLLVYDIYRGQPLDFKGVGGSQYEDFERSDSPASSLMVEQVSHPSSEQSTPLLQEIVKLTQAKMSDDVILGYIKSSGASFNASASDILYLNSQGVSQPVISALMSGSASTTSSSQPASPVSTTPDTAQSGIAPGSAGDLVEQGNTLYRSSRYDDALQCYNKALEIDPQLGRALYGKAVVEDTLSQPGEAIRAYRKFIKLASPDDAALVATARDRLARLGWHGSPP